MFCGAEVRGSPNWVVVIRGNPFVCVSFEGPIVGIQVLSEYYYELFGMVLTEEVDLGI